MDLGITKKVAPLIDAVRDMVNNEIELLDAEFHSEVGKHPSGDRFQHTDRQLEILDQLKATARERVMEFLVNRQRKRIWFNNRRICLFG